MDDLIKRARKLSSLAEKATPGPWFVKEGVATCKVTGETYRDGYRIYGKCVENVETPHWFSSVGGADWGEHEANLMAAAPEMAHLLQELADELEKLISKDHNTKCCSMHYNNFR